MGDRFCCMPHGNTIVDRSEHALELEHEERRKDFDDLRAEICADWRELNARIDDVEAKVDRLTALVERLGVANMDDLR